MFVTHAPYSAATLDDYRSLIGDDVVSRLRERADRMRGLRILHINATLVGGGVSEILLSLIPMMRDAGICADWYVMDGSDAFFEVTKRFHNALQGAPTLWARRYLEIYHRGNEENLASLGQRVEDYDVVVVHDPQPLALRSLMPRHRGVWIWRCHLDLTAPNAHYWAALSPYLAGYDAAVFSTPEYVPAELTPPAMTALPCIDAFRPKNTPLEPSEVARVLGRYGVDPERPYLLQVSRFDPWKDPIGVVDVYRHAKAVHPDLQLVYMASMAADDPEGRRVYEQVRSAAGDDPDIKLLALDVPPHRADDNAREVNAMQSGARVVLQKSIREGFGLTVTEALWKAKPVVAGNVGGIRHQIRDGENGFLVDDVAQCADRVLELLADPGAAAELGRRGQETVRKRFLMTRLLDQYLGWFDELTGGRRVRAYGRGNGRVNGNGAVPPTNGRR